MTASISRRSFLRGSALLAGAAGVAGTGLPATLLADATRAALPATALAPVVEISANEYPDGPSAAALAAMSQVAPTGGRYGYGLTVELAEEIVRQEGLPGLEYIAIYPGSTAPLDLSVVAFTGPDRSLVTALPSYEQGWRTAAKNGAQVHKLMQRADYSHDVQAMCAADPNAGLIYICNPNNPTGAITSRADIEYVLANKPAGSILVLDEAYIQFSENAVSGVDLVASGEDVVVLRTFSKLYGMAGIRLGFAAARPDLIEKIKAFNIGQIPITSSAAGLAMLRDPDLVPTRRAQNKAILTDTVDWLAAKGYPSSKSEANCFMLDTKRPVREFIDAMATHGVNVGRGWEGFPTQSRITVGTVEDMTRFKEAFVRAEAGEQGPYPLPQRRRLAGDLRDVVYIDGVMLT